MNNEKPKVFAIGGTGLIGSRIKSVLEDKFDFDDLSLDTGFDITKEETMNFIADDKEHKFVLHLAAKADVDGCEKDKELGEEGAAYIINVKGSKNVAEACKSSGKKMIYISTDFVFDGENVPEGGYTEESTPSPVNWYAKTKYMGEEMVRNSGVPYQIVRLAYPFRKDEFALKKDFVHAVRDRLRDGLPVKAVTDHVMTPTYIDDIAAALGRLMESDSTGIFHVVGSQSLSPYDASLKIAEKFGLDKKLVSQITRAEFFAGRAPRPFNLSLNNDRIEQLGLKMMSFEEGLSLLQKV